MMRRGRGEGGAARLTSLYMAWADCNLRIRARCEKWQLHVVSSFRLDYYLRKKGTACVSHTSIHATTCTIIIIHKNVLIFTLSLPMYQLVCSSPGKMISAPGLECFCYCLLSVAFTCLTDPRVCQCFYAYKANFLWSVIDRLIRRYSLFTETDGPGFESERGACCMVIITFPLH